MIYLDYAAATPMDTKVQAAMTPFWHKDFYNPSATYLAGKDVADSLRQARQTVAACLGARPAEIVFTAGGTEANNLAIHGVMRHYPNANMVVSAIEHEAVLQVAAQYTHQVAPVDEAAVVDIPALQKLINDKTALVSVMYANNEVGSIQPLSRIAKIVQDIRHQRVLSGNTLPLYLHTDASQAGNYLDMHVSRLGVDMMTINGGKIYGPKQTGALFVKAGIDLEPLILGGGQEKGLRSGTENVAGYVGLATALELAQNQRKTEGERVQALQELFTAELLKFEPAVTLNSHNRSCLPNFVHVTFPAVDNERLMMQLDEQGIMCAVGSACQASNDDPSHVLLAMGLSQEQAQSSLRFTFGRPTTQADIKKTVSTLKLLLLS